MFAKKKNEEWVLITLLTIILLMVLYSLSRLLALQKRVYELEMNQVDEKSTKELIHEEMGNAVSGIRKEISTRLMPEKPQIPMPPPQVPAHAAHAAHAAHVSFQATASTASTTGTASTGSPGSPGSPSATASTGSTASPATVAPSMPVTEAEEMPALVDERLDDVSADAPVEVSSVPMEVPSVPVDVPVWSAKGPLVAEDVISEASVHLAPVTLEVNPSKKRTTKKPKNGGVEVQLG